MDISKNSMNNDKSLCLYCDKTFSNINDQENHVERDHKAVLNKGKGSLRKSERITKNSTSENSHFAACFYCNNKKIIKSDDLESLFQHLLTAHKDIYFGCKCRTRLLDKTSLTNHRKNCKIGGGKNFKSATSSDAGSEKVLPEKRKTAKKSQSKSNVDAKCDSYNSESESISTTASFAAAAATTTKNNSVKTLPTNAINKKSDRSNAKNSNSCKSANHHNSDKRSKNKVISSSSSSVSSSSSSKASDEYTIPLTRQKLKEPTPQKNNPQQQQQQQNSHHNLSLSNNNKKLHKHGKSSTATATAAATSSAAASTSGSEKSSLSSSNASSPTKVQRTKSSKVINQNLQSNCESIEMIQKSEIINTEFDDDFYKNISLNIRENLNYHIDGKVDRLQLSKPAFDRISTNETKATPMLTEASSSNACKIELKVSPHSSNQDLSSIASPVAATSTASLEKEIHESTNFELSTPFPALLTVEQYGFGDSNPNKNKRHITKNSWKWKWDLIKKYKYVNEGGKIVKKVKQITTGLKDLSQLDMWTQLSMRSRYENLNSNQSTVEFDDNLNDSLSTRMIKTQNLEQLNSILDKRLQPEINIEQLQQTLVKEELIETEIITESVATEANNMDESIDSEMLGMLKLSKSNELKVSDPALSGEWARPRCFVCVDCGQEFDLMKSLNDHKNSEHPYVVSAHYEVVGRENLEQKLYRNLFLPKKALQLNANAATKSISINSDSKSNDATSTSESSSNFPTDQKEKECTKCMKMIKYSNDIDIYRHILDCIEDRVWMQAKKRSKYRRSRRKSKKNMRKSRLSTDQKKSTSSPFQKENTEGENSTLSISNPPTPKEDSIKKPIAAAVVAKTAKIESFISDSAPASNDGMNIKSFFRVSKTTPNLPQKVVVQMLEMPKNPISTSPSTTTSLRHSLRSSAKKLSNQHHEVHHQKPKESNETIERKNDDSLKTKKIKEETISEETKIETKNTNETKPTIAELPALQITDLSDKSLKLSSPASSPPPALVSPTSSSNVPKKKKKLNDCIAMLTCKIQEKLGVNFFDSSTKTEIFPVENAAKHEEEPQSQSPSLLISPTSPCTSPIITPNPIVNITAKASIVPLKTPPPLLPEKSPSQPEFACPEQDEVIDLSVKKKSEVKQEKLKFPSLHDNNMVAIPKANLNEATTKSNRYNIDTILKVPVPTISSSLQNHIDVLAVALLKPTAKNQTEISDKQVKTEEKKDLNECAEAAESEETKIDDLIDINDIKESFKISISKDRIPNLEEILKENQVTKVSSLTISDAERKAFEEQKNRIRQILSKSKKSPAKKPTKKAIAAAKKSPLKKNNAKELKEQENDVADEAIVAEKPAEDIVKITAEIIESKEPLQPVASENVETKEIELADNIADDVKPLIETKQETEKTAADEPPEINIENKIQAVIKNTNRIRCRRLSVVVDPIIHLSAFQSTNRKIRLTNNSQQNGFYDMLTNEQLFNAIKPQLKDEIQKSVKSTGKNSIKEAIEEVFAAKAKPKAATSKTPAKSKAKARRTGKRRKSNFSRKSRKSKPAIVEAASTDILPKQSDKKPEAKEVATVAAPVQVDKKADDKPMTIEKKDSVAVEEKSLATSTPKKAAEVKQVAPAEESKVLPKGKQQQKKKQQKEETPAEIKIVEVALVKEEAVIQKKLPKGKQQKAKLPEPEPTPAKKSPSKAKQKEPAEIETPSVAKKQVEDLPKIDSKILAKATKSQPKQAAKVEEKKSSPARKGAAKSKAATKSKIAEKELQESSKDDEKLALDISQSSDTSNENDIPLAKLITTNQQAEIITEAKKPEESLAATPMKANSKKKAVQKKAAKKKSTAKNIRQTVALKEIAIDKKAEEDSKLKDESIVMIEELQVKTEIDENALQKSKKHQKEAAQKMIVEKMEIFDMDEDSFFNDDNDIDQADEKINDLVNNIINSSELIDSESEKNEKLNLDEKQEEAKCLICKRSFKNEKVLERHNKTSTHLFKEARRERRIAELKDKETLKVQDEKEKEEAEVVIKAANENPPSITITPDEIKIFRTKGALKTFENILPSTNNHISEVKPSFEPSQPPPPPLPIKELKPLINACSIPDIKDFKPINVNSKKQQSVPLVIEDDENDDLSRKDKIFDSLFSNIENKLAAAANAALPPVKKIAFPSLTPQESEIESSSTSWDLQHDADIEWDGINANDNNQPSLMNSVKEVKPQKKINKPKEAAMSIPTKSLIMGKIFKKHRDRDREKQKTPQADAPNNKPGIKNSLDEIFDHLKNSAEIDDKVLTCPSPKTLLKSSGSTFSPQHSNEMIETASQSNNNNNNIYSKKLIAAAASTTQQDKPSSTTSFLKEQQQQQQKKQKKKDDMNCKSKLNDTSTTNDEEEDGIGVRKSRRRCAIKTKTFAETWSSDEYEELHDTNDIISIINEIEKRESNANKKRKPSKSESLSTDNNLVAIRKSEEPQEDQQHKSHQNNNLHLQQQQKSISILKANETAAEKKSVQLQFPTISKPSVNSLAIKKRKISTLKDGHKSDEETFTATKDLKPLKPSLAVMKKRRMSCFVPSTAFNDLSPSPPKAAAASTPIKTIKKHSNNNVNVNSGLFKKYECEKNGSNNNNNSTSAAVKKKVQKHRKRPRNKIKNIAYDSDSDFELNISKKSKNAPSSTAASTAAFSDSVSDDDDEEEEDDHEIVLKPTSQSTSSLVKGTTATATSTNSSSNSSSSSSNSNTNELTMIKEPKLLPNDLNVVQPATTTANAAIPEDIIDSLQSAGNRTKRHSSEKLYYWSSSSESDLEHGDTADGENNEDSMIPQQPEQHGWIVGDSHKKLVTLLAHAKIKNKIN